MNAIDLIVCLVLALAVWNGWRQGFVVQVCSLAGVVAGIWLAAHYGGRVGAWLELDGEFAAAGGFAAVLVAVVLAVAVAAGGGGRRWRLGGVGLAGLRRGGGLPPPGVLGHLLQSGVQ